MFNSLDLSIDKAAAALIEGESDLIANLANLAALIPQYMNRINWAGFYIMKDGELVLGPFQGLPACVRIPVGKGVCGSAAKDMKTIAVDDVLSFPGHIACDANSRSEIVVPIIKNGKVLAVIDVDSPEPSRFGENERGLLEALAKAAKQVFTD